MSGGDRGGHSQALGFLALVGILLVSGLAWGLGYLQGGETERRYQTPTAYSQAAKSDAERACAGADVGAVFECIYEKVEAAQDQAHDEQDLSAQQRAANAALASSIIGALTLIATGIGLWFIRRTLDATLRAVEEAEQGTRAAVIAAEASAQSVKVMQDSTRKQLQAYFAVEAKMIFGSAYPVFTITLRNTGATTARDIWLKFRPYMTPVTKLITPDTPNPREGVYLGDIEPNDTRDYRETITVLNRRRLDEIFKEEIIFGVLVAVDYGTLFETVSSRDYDFAATGQEFFSGKFTRFR